MLTAQKNQPGCATTKAPSWAFLLPQREPLLMLLGRESISGRGSERLFYEVPEADTGFASEKLGLSLKLCSDVSPL